ncbi:MAG TPA: PAS domain S-box protein [Stenomitos sp.]
MPAARKDSLTEALAAHDPLAYKALYEESPSIYFVIDAESTVLAINRIGAAQLGYAVEELEGRSILSITHPEDRDRLRQQIRDCGAESCTLSFQEFRKLRKEGGVLWVREVARSVQGSDDRTVVLVVCEDITAKKQAEQRLRESEERYRRLIETSLEGVWLLDADNKTTFVNAEMARMLGYSVEDMMGASLFDFMNEHERAIARRNVERRKHGIKEVHDFKFRRKDGAEIWTMVSANPIFDPDGQFAGSLGMVRDITFRKQVEKELARRAAELEKSNERLKELDRLKSSFVDTISHELRTPLTSIKGYAEFLEDNIGGPLTLQQRQFVEEILDGSSQLERLVDDLLDFAKLESGTFTLRPARSDLRDRVREILKVLKPQADENGIQLEATLPDEPLVLQMDAGRIGQVLLNLVGNAIKFTRPGGRITVTATAVADAVRVEVHDTGVGIPPEHLPHLFKRFYQVDTSSTRESSGTGLGLAISKALVEAHGGQMGVESTPGKGSTFWFTLPVSAGSEA